MNNENKFNEKKNNNNKNYSNDNIKKTPEEREKERQAKLEKRKKIFTKMNKKTKFGQPVMKYRVENLLQKIKAKIKKGEY